jgi:S-adenosylmethionine uptake transporter
MVIASVLFAAMGALMYQVKLWDPNASPLSASFLRAVVNLFFVIALASRKGLGRGVLDLFGDMRGSLWARGFFGTLSLIGLVASIHMIGLGEASFLHSFNAVWVAALSPFVLGQPNTKWGWAAICLGIFGLYLLYQPDFTGQEFMGRTIALASGAFAGTAYMMISRAGRSNSPLTVVFYLCFVATIAHLGWFYLDHFYWPSDTRSWIMLITAGLFGSVAQMFLTSAYQLAPAAVVSASSYTTPVFNLIVGMFVFSNVPNTRGLIGAIIVLIAGVALPFLQVRRWSKIPRDAAPMEVTER